MSEVKTGDRTLGDEMAWAMTVVLAMAGAGMWALILLLAVHWYVFLGLAALKQAAVLWTILSQPPAAAVEHVDHSVQAPSEPLAQSALEIATEPQTPAPEIPTEVVSLPELAPAHIDGFSLTWVGSPNYNLRPYPHHISLIVIHATAGRTLAGVRAWFDNPRSRVSAHYSVGKDGQISQHVPDEYRAWHAGVSEWQGRPNVNNFSIGIELVNLNDGRDPYPEVQHQALVSLVTYLCWKHRINPDQIVSHAEVAQPTGRKVDPRGYDLGRLRQEVGERLGQ